MARDRARDLLADATGLFALVLFVCALLYGVQQAQRAPGVDYYQFWVMARAASGAERDTLYAPGTSRALGLEQLERARALPESSRFRRAAEWNERTNPDLLDPISTPFYYAAIGALATGDYERDFAVYQALLGAAFAVGLVGLCRLLGYPWPAALAASALVLLFFGPLASDVNAGNVARGQLAGLACALALLRGRGPSGPFLAGLALALLAAWKPNLVFVPAALIATWAPHGRMRALRAGGAGLVAGAALGLAIGAAYLGSLARWGDWLEVTRRYLAKPYPLESFNVSLATLVHAWTSTDVSVALALAIGAAYAACAWLGRRSVGSEADADLLAIGVGCLLPLVAAQIAWDHYFVLALPLLLYFLRPGAASPERLVAAAAFLLLAQSPLNVVVPLATPHQVALAFAASATALLALALRAVYARPRESTSSSRRW